MFAPETNRLDMSREASTEATNEPTSAPPNVLATAVDIDSFKGHSGDHQAGLRTDSHTDTGVRSGDGPEHRGDGRLAGFVLFRHLLQG